MATAIKKKRDTRRLARLRQRAEARLKKSPPPVSETRSGDAQTLVHDLRVHQAELEMQNDELRRVQFELENSRDRFASLYDLAPVGFLTLDINGVIREANQTAARLLGLDRPMLLKKPFSRFISAESQDDFYLHRQRIFTSAGPHRCELLMRGPDGTGFVSRLESIAETGGKGAPKQCLTAFSDVTRERQAETAVRESQAQLAGIIRSAMDAIITVNSEQRVVLCNEAAEKMFGRAAGELIGQPLDRLIPKAARAAHARHVRKFGNAGVTSRRMGELGHVSGLRADGTEFPIEASISQVEHGGEKLFTVILRDISARLEAESMRALLAAIVESSSDAISSRTLDGLITTWNPAAERLFGYTASEIVGQRFHPLVPADRPDELSRIRSAIANGERIDGYETERVAKDGRRIAVAVSISPIRDSQGKLVGSSVIYRNITHHLEAEKFRRQSEAALAAFFEESPLGLMWAGSDGLILKTNPAQLELLGRPGDEILGHRLSEFFADPELVAEGMEKLFNREVLKDYRLRLRTRDGSLRHVLADAVGLWEKERLVRTHWYVRDITRRVELEREILRISEFEQQRFGQELHDDLCQQLTGLEYLAHSLAEDLSSTSKTGARRAAAIAKLLCEANTHARELSHGLAPMDLAADGLRGALEKLARRTREVFRRDCRLRGPKPVQINDPAVRQHLYRIAQEAVGNAIKHGKATRIVIALARNGDRVNLGIRDNGMGLPKKPRRKQGMGLRIMQYRAGVISGSLVVQRNPDGGTSVVCSVPDTVASLESRRQK